MSPFKRTHNLGVDEKVEWGWGGHGQRGSLLQMGGEHLQVILFLRLWGGGKKDSRRFSDLMLKH